MKVICFSIFFSLLSVLSIAQQKPIGQWRGHMPYNEAISLATDGVNLFTVTKESFYVLNSAQSEIQTYSKVNGMSDAMMQFVAYDAVNGYVILGYQNSNIDIYRNGTFYNLPDIKLRVLNGDKSIYHIHTSGGLAYVSTGFGVVVINPERREVKESYTFQANNVTVGVRGFIDDQGFFYAATRGGLFRAPKSAGNLQAFSAWQQLDSRPALFRMANMNNAIYAAQKDTVFRWANGTMTPVFSVDKAVAEITDISKSLDNHLWVTLFYSQLYRGVTLKLNLNNYQIVDSFKDLWQPWQSVQTADSTVWVADQGRGLGRAPNSKAGFGFYQPSGPAAYTSFGILPYNNVVWVAHGSIDDKFNYKYNRYGISQLKDERWDYIKQSTLDTLRRADATDFINVVRDPVTQTVYAPSFRSGLFIQKPDGSRFLLQKPFFPETTLDPNTYRVGIAGFDSKGNLWMTQSLTVADLVMKNQNDQWFRFQGPGASKQVMYLAIDDLDQIWYGLPGVGIAVMNPQGTPENPVDDQYRVMNLSDGLPGSTVYSIAKDKQGSIWIGTDNGIGIVSCPGEVISRQCNIDKPIVQFDQFAGYLFQGEKVNAIAVDGANRKWVGTTNGVWLLSPDGNKIIERFTVDNSPLPANGIQTIAIDPVTGDVYFGTDLGLVSFRYTATEGGLTNSNVTTFPNPVPVGYTGTIAIRGLVGQADVRITDVSGQLVYRTKANGGQATWNGLDYTGRRPQSGVYLIFITNDDGTQTQVAKMVFLE